MQGNEVNVANLSVRLQVLSIKSVIKNFPKKCHKKVATLSVRLQVLKTFTFLRLLCHSC